MDGTQRFTFIDGLRGIAAVSVLVHHAMCRTIFAPGLMGSMPGLAWGVLFHLNAGVQIFFAISGFVIAHSLRDCAFTPRELGRFYLRRQLRLDPPYWVVVAGALACGWMAARAGVTIRGAANLGSGDVAANLVYCQGLLGWPAVLDVAWTLCIELQFYLAYTLLMVVSGAGRRARPESASNVLLFGTAVASICVRQPIEPAATLLPYWWGFAGGALCYRACRHQIGAWVLPALLLAGLGASIAVGRFDWRFAIPDAVGWATLAWVYRVGRAGELASALSGRAAQYFGAISYSLYLVHVTVLGIVTRGGVRLLHLNGAWGVVLIPVGMVASVGVAHVLHVIVERPSQRMARRFGRREEGRGPVPRRIPALVAKAA